MASRMALEGSSHFENVRSATAPVFVQRFHGENPFFNVWSIEDRSSAPRTRRPRRRRYAQTVSFDR